MKTRPDEKHGHAKRNSPEYRVWSQMLMRCTNPRAPNFIAYGGAGVSVCERWARSFVAFLADMGERPAGTTLDRINNDGNYEPGNCRWATPREQAINRRTTRMVEIDGLRLSLTDHARRIGISDTALHYRLRMGFAGPRLTAPSRRPAPRLAGAP